METKFPKKSRKRKRKGKEKREWGCSLVIKYLPGMHEALDLILNIRN
jgi:hypothetical protein